MSVRRWFQYAWFLVDDTDGVLGSVYHGEGEVTWFAYTRGGPVLARGTALSLEHAHECILDAHLTAAIKSRRDNHARSDRRVLAGA